MADKKKEFYCIEHLNWNDHCTEQCRMCGDIETIRSKKIISVKHTDYENKNGHKGDMIN